MRRLWWSLALLLLVSPVASAQTSSRTIDGRTYVSADSGATWTAWTAGTTVAAASTQAPTASFTNDVRLWVSANSGTTWSPWSGVLSTMSSALLFSPDNTYDIGSFTSSLRPKNIHLAGFVSSGTSGYGFGGNSGASEGLTTSGVTLNINSGTAGGINFQTSGGNAPIMKYTATAPTIASGFGSSPAILSGTSAGFRVNVGTGGTVTTGVITLPTATTGWNCVADDLTALAAHTADRRTVVTATTTTSVSLENQIVSTGATVGAPWAASDTLVVLCTPY